MTVLATTRSRPGRPPSVRVLAATALAALASAVLNACLRYAALAIFDIPQPQFEPLNLDAVVISSMLGAGAGGAFFAVLARLTRRPTRVFIPVAATVLALSMIPVLLLNVADPPQFQGAGAAAGTTLALMHMVVAVVLVAALRAAQRPSVDERTRR